MYGFGAVDVILVDVGVDGGGVVGGGVVEVAGVAIGMLWYEDIFFWVAGI